MEEIVQNELLFYSKLAKPLMLNLPQSKDRILAAGWLKKCLQENSGEEKQRIIYLKLLIFCMQTRRLTGIFADDPLMYDKLEELPEDIDLNDFARNILEQEKVDKRERVRREMMGDMAEFPAYTTDCSPDLTEYVAAQDIPNFGVHAFYAISKQPISKWQRADKAIFPKGTMTSVETTTKTKKPKCVCAPGEMVVVEGEQPECRKEEEPPPSTKRKSRPKKLGTSPPIQPIGEVKRHDEDRHTPTWGTNLLKVMETTDYGNIDEPSAEAKALDEEVCKLLEEEQLEEEEAEETMARKAGEMIETIDEYGHGRMDKRVKKPKPPGKKRKQPVADVEALIKKRRADKPATEILLDDTQLDYQSLGEIEHSIYDEGVEEDEPIVELFEDEIMDLQEEAHMSHLTRELTSTTPALAAAVPVTTPHRGGSPRRLRVPERVFAQPDDDLLVHRVSPLRTPKRKTPEKALGKTQPDRMDARDPCITQVFKKAKHTVDPPPKKSDEDLELDEFERMEKDFQKETSESPRPPRQAPPSPGAQEIYRRAEAQQMSLMFPSTPPQQIGSPDRTTDSSFGILSPTAMKGSPKRREVRKSLFRFGSPEAYGILDEAQNVLVEDLFEDLSEEEREDLSIGGFSSPGCYDGCPSRKYGRRYL